MTALLRGEPGIGKSRLVESVLAMARAEGLWVALAEISDFGERAALSPRRQLAMALSRLPGTAAHVAAQSRRLQAAHAQILGQPLPSPGAGDGIGDPERIAAIEGLIAAAASRAPLLLVVEDAHWADSDGLAQIGRISRLVAEHPVLLLVTVRSEEDPFDLSWRQSAGPMLTIDLPPLDVAAATEAARALGAGRAAEACARRANGNPPVLRQLVAAVADGADPAAVLPGSVHSLTLGRLDRLDPPSRQALAAAAILGRESELEAVQDVAGLPDWRPPPAALGALVRIEGEAGAERLRFAHALVRDAVRAAVLDSEARALHRRVAAHYRGRAPDVAARHLARAGDPGAVALFAEAAQAALASHRADPLRAAADPGHARLLHVCRRAGRAGRRGRGPLGRDAGGALRPRLLERRPPRGTRPRRGGTGASGRGRAGAVRRRAARALGRGADRDGAELLSVPQGRADDTARAARFRARARGEAALSWLRPVMRIVEVRAGAALTTGRG